MIVHLIRAYDPISDDLKGEYLLSPDGAKQVIGMMMRAVHEEAEVVQIRARHLASVAKILGVPLDPRHDHFLEFVTA